MTEYRAFCATSALRFNICHECGMTWSGRHVCEVANRYAALCERLEALAVKLDDLSTDEHDEAELARKCGDRDMWVACCARLKAYAGSAVRIRSAIKGG